MSVMSTVCTCIVQPFYRCCWSTPIQLNTKNYDLSSVGRVRKDIFTLHFKVSTNPTWYGVKDRLSKNNALIFRMNDLRQTCSALFKCQLHSPTLFLQKSVEWLSRGITVGHFLSYLMERQVAMTKVSTLAGSLSLSVVGLMLHTESQRAFISMTHRKGDIPVFMWKQKPNTASRDWSHQTNDKPLVFFLLWQQLTPVANTCRHSEPLHTANSRIVVLQEPRLHSSPLLNNMHPRPQDI